MNKQLVRNRRSFCVLCGAMMCFAVETTFGQIAESTATPEAGSPQFEPAWRAAINRAIAEQNRRLHSVEVMLPLVNQGDPEAIEEVVADLESRRVLRQAEQTLERCVQPRVIGAVGDFLNLAEGAELQFVEDVGVRPKSVEAGRIIQSILRNSPVFDVDVKRWAAGDLGYTLSGDDKSEFRRQMRVWWDQNRTAILAERYQDVKPPTPNAGTAN